MDRLSALDTEFLHLEDDTSPMHIASVCVFAGPAPSLTELTDLLESKLHELPRYRQVIRTVRRKQQGQRVRRKWRMFATEHLTD